MGNTTKEEKCLESFNEWDFIPTYDCHKECKSCDSCTVDQKEDKVSVCQYCVDGREKCPKLCIEDKKECCKCKEAEWVEGCTR